MSTYNKIADLVTKWAGGPIAFSLAFFMILAWFVFGPFFHFSDTYQLIINTATTIITFIMVFVIQHSQNRDGIAIQAKLDELIRATDTARNDLIGVEKAPENEIERLRNETE